MKKVGIIIFAAAVVTGIVVSNLFSVRESATTFFNFSFNFKDERGSGNVITQNRPLSGFTAIEVGGIFEVEVTSQKEFGVVVEADDNLLELIKTEVDGGVLKIETDEKVSPSSPIRITISAPDIDRLSISGVASVSVNDINNKKLTIDASGASKINLAGQTSQLTIDVSGATKVDAEKLSAENANIEASGASKAGVNITGNLRADASGASKIFYTGTPASIEKSTTGAARISPR